MPEKDYISKVYTALKENVEGFNTDEKTFSDKLSKDPEYGDKVYNALKDNVQGFDKSQQDFYSSVKKKEQTISPTSTLSSKELPQVAKEKSPSESSTSVSAPIKSESTKTKKFELPSAALPGSVMEHPAKQKDVIKQHLKDREAAVNKDYNDVNIAYQSLKSKTDPLTLILNNPLSPQLQKQFAQSQLQELAPQIQEVQQKRDAYKQQYEKYLVDVKQSATKLKEISNQNASYLEGAGKSIAHGTADILDAMQGANDFLSKHVFGYDRGEDSGKGMYNDWANHLRESADNNLENVPDNLAGKIVSGVAGSIPVLLATAIAPETQIPRFATTMGAIGFGQSYQKDKNVLKAVQEGAYGLTEGAILHGLGVSGEHIGEWASKTKLGETVGQELTGKSAAALITSAGFGGEDAAKQYLETGKIDLGQVAASAGTGVAFSLGGLAKSAYERAFTKTVTSEPGAIKEAINVPNTATELRNESANILEQGVGKSPEERTKAFLISKSLSDLSDMKSLGEDIANNPSKHISDVQSSDWSPEQKQQAVSNINAIVEQNNKNVQEAKPLKQEKANLESQLENSKLIEDPDLRDAEMNRINGEIKYKQGEIEKALNKPIIKTDESKTSKVASQESQKGQEGGKEGVLSITEQPAAKEVAAEKGTQAPPEAEAKGGVLQESLPETKKRIIPFTEPGQLKGTNPSEILHFGQGDGNNKVTLLVDANVKSEYSDKLSKAKKISGGSTSFMKHPLKDIAKEFRASYGQDVIVDLRGIDINQPIEDIVKQLKTQEHAIKEREIEKSSQSEHIETQPRGVSAKTSDSNSPEPSKEGEKKIISAAEQAAYNEKLLAEQAQSEKEYVPPEQQAKESKVGYVQNFIHENLGRIRKEDFIHYADKNLLEGRGRELQIKHFKNDAPPLDTIAQELSDSAGVEITPQDIVDYIVDRDNFPDKYKKGVLANEPEAPMAESTTEQSLKPESVKFNNEEYLVERTPDGNVNFKDSKGNVVNPNDGPKELKLYKQLTREMEQQKGSVGSTKTDISQQNKVRGLPELDKQAKRDSGEDWEKAKENVDSGKSNIRQIGEDILKGNRQATATQKLEMGYELSKAIQNFDDISEKMKLPENEFSLGIIDEAILAEQNMRFWQEVNDKAQSEWGLFGKYSQALVTKTRELLWVKQRLANIETVDKNSKEAIAAREELEKLHKEYSDLKTKSEENDKKLKEEIINIQKENQNLFEQTERDKSIRADLIRKIADLNKQKYRDTKTKIRQDRKTSFENIKRILSEKPKGPHGIEVTREGLLPISDSQIREITPELISIFEGYVKDGIVSAAEIIDNIVRAFKEDGRHITHQQISDAMGFKLDMEKELKDLEEMKVQDAQAKIIKNLERTIDNLEKGVKRKEKPSVPTNDKIKELKKKRDDLQNKAKLNKDVKYEQEQAWKKVEGVIEKREEENKKFIDRVKEKIKIEAGGLFKSLMAGVDFSAVGVQGAILSAGNLSKVPGSLSRMFKNTFSEKAANRFMYDIKTSDGYKTMKKAGLYLSEPKAKEELFQSSTAESIPIWGKYFIQSTERAFAGYLNKMRVDVFTRGMENLARLGKSPEKNPEEYKALATAINNLTGRGHLGALEKVSNELNVVAFSARNIASQFHTLGLSDIALVFSKKKGFYGSLTPTARKMVAKNLLSATGMAIGIMALAKAGGADIEDDPRSTDFGKIKVGNTRINILGGYQGLIRLTAQLISGEKKSVASGKVKGLAEGYKAEGRIGAVGSFLRGKESPTVSLIHDWLARQDKDKVYETRNVIGQKMTVGDELLNRITPFLMQDIYDVYKDSGVKNAGELFVPALFGAGMNTFGGEQDKINKFEERHQKEKEHRVPKTAEEKKDFRESKKESARQKKEYRNWEQGLK